jgi:hypothetical protein
MAKCRTNQQILTASRRYGSELEVAAIIGVSPRTLQKKRLLGEPPIFYRFGGRILYDLAEVEQLIRSSASLPPKTTRLENSAS